MYAYDPALPLDMGPTASHVHRARESFRLGPGRNVARRGVSAGGTARHKRARVPGDVFGI